MIPRAGNSATRALARWVGSILCILLGVWCLFAAMGAFFIANNIRTLQDLATTLAPILALLSVLPLGVVAIFRPRLAAHGIALCWLALMIVAYGSLPWRETASWSLSDVLHPVLFYFPPALCLVALLLYGAGPAPDHGVPGGAEGATASVVECRMTRLAGFLGLGVRARHAQWGAVVLGILVGGWRLRSGATLALRFGAVHDWVGVIGVAASSLVVLPLAILGIWRPRVAAYLLAASVVVALAYPMRAARGLGDVLAYLVWASVPALPLALVAGLFLCASSPGRAGAEP